MKNFLFFLLILTSLSCNFSAVTSTKIVSEEPAIKKQEVIKDVVNRTMEKWHQAAAQADFEEYFSLMTEDGVFLGTDATENWQNDKFREFAKPYFDKGKAWNFSTIERNIYAADNGKTAWFDELLDTQMGICRGSGILVKTENGWKIKHYVLSIAIPNENVEEVTALKKGFDDELISRLK